MATLSQKKIYSKCINRMILPMMINNQSMKMMKKQNANLNSGNVASSLNTHRKRMMSSWKKGIIELKVTNRTIMINLIQASIFNIQEALLDQVQDHLTFSQTKLGESITKQELNYKILLMNNVPLPFWYSVSLQMCGYIAISKNAESELLKCSKVQLKWVKTRST